MLLDIELLELEVSLSYVFLRSLSREPVLANLRYLKINLSADVGEENLQKVMKYVFALNNISWSTRAESWKRCKLYLKGCP